MRAEGDEERAADEATFREANEQIRAAERTLEPPDVSGAVARSLDPRKERA